MTIALQPHWRMIQRENFRRIDDLALFLELDENNRKSLLPRSKFPLNFPKRLAQKCEKNNLQDPIVKQFLPLISENTNPSSSYCPDPVGDTLAQKTPKLLHKYKGRALILASASCAMHCRYCFRKNFDYEIDQKGFAAELKYIENDPSIFEVILSGGDPLSLSDENLQELICELEKITHVKLLRFHSRFPIGIPERLTQQFIKMTSDSRLQTTFVVHTNHVRELDNDVLSALKELQKSGTPILSHTVLLKDINDDAKILKELFLELACNGILPYYLNQFDKVQNASHFDVDIEKGKQIHKELMCLLPGYAVPRYVQEITGKAHKTPII